MTQKYVMRCRYVQPDGIGYVTKDGGCTRNRSLAQIYDSEADAWTHAAGANLIGYDEDGDWVWPEPVDIS